MDVDAERAARRARREERRERQRAANLGRAAKMHVARVEWEGNKGTEVGRGEGTEARRHGGTKGRALRGGRR